MVGNRSAGRFVGPLVRRTAVLAVLAAAASSCATTGETALVANWQLAEEADPTDTELVIDVLGGGCNADEERLGDIDVTETPERGGIVARIVKPESGARDCSSIGTSHRTTVILDEPLGHRLLGGCDLARPPSPAVDCTRSTGIEQDLD